MPADEVCSSELEEIDRETCLELLRSQPIGRIAVALPSGPPLVVPVNYIVLGQDIVFRTDPGTKLDAICEQPVSFEVDLIDPFRRTGWSVLAQGIADETTPGDIDSLELESWAGGDKRHWVRVTPTAITGRRIRLPEIPVEARGYL